VYFAIYTLPNILYKVRESKRLYAPERCAMDNMKRTPLYDEHVKLGAKMTEFGGWEMPLLYEGIVKEHMAVRQKAGIFDVSHMGDLYIHGKDAGNFLSRMTTGDFNKLKVGSAKYVHILNEEGKIKDDAIGYRLSEEEYLFVPNAGPTPMIEEWFKSHSDGFDVEIENHTDDLVCIAFQGPEARKMLSNISKDASETKFFKMRWADLGLQREGAEGFLSYFSDKSLISGTGYTGEDGFEIITLRNQGIELWKKLIEMGAVPCGLGARDTLRLEKGFLLSGQDFNEDRTTLETGWDFVIDWDHDFIGKDALMKQKERGDYDLWMGLIMEKGIARHGYEVYKDGEKIGVVTSGTKSPVLGKGIAMAYLKREYAKKGEKVQVDVRGKLYDADVVKTPFV